MDRVRTPQSCTMTNKPMVTDAESTTYPDLWVSAVRPCARSWNGEKIRRYKLIKSQHAGESSHTGRRLGVPNQEDAERRRLQGLGVCGLLSVYACGQGVRDTPLHLGEQAVLYPGLCLENSVRG